MKLLLGRVALFVTTIVGALVAGVSACQADSTPSPFLVRLGTLFPYDDQTRGLGGVAPAAFGFEYKPVKASLGVSHVGLYADYFQESTSKARVSGVGTGIAFEVGNRLRFGFGAGPSTTYTTWYGPVYSWSENRTRLGGRLYIGKQVGTDGAIELTDYVYPASIDLNPSGFGLTYSVRL